jgi:hypothetical protein
MYAVVKTVATILSLIFFIDRTGRRNLLLISSVGTSAALWYIGGFVAASNIDLTTVQAKSPAGWVAIVCVYVYAVSNESGHLHNISDSDLGLLLGCLEWRCVGLLF